MPTLPRPTYGSPVTPRNPVNICRLSEELIPVRFRRVNPAASLKQCDLPATHPHGVGERRFRRVNPAASLKLAVRDEDRQRVLRCVRGRGAPLVSAG